MSTRTIRVVIGKNFGDEGKGLAVDYFCGRAPESLVVKHNGGAQAGHTVEQGGRRFVFHQLSAGSFRRSDTLWARTYYPDLYKLREEEEEFYAAAGFRPAVWSELDTPVTLIDDVLINMLLETRRGAARHGSCGMGIYEAYLRTRAGFGLTVGDFLSENAASLTARILQIRREYTWKRIAEAVAAEGDGRPVCSGTAEEVGRQGLSDAVEEISGQGLPGTEYLEMLRSRQVIEGYVDEMLRNAAAFVKVSEDTGALLRSRESIVFESGQGLLLDEGNTRFAPHISASRTGLANPVEILAEHGLVPTEAVYVTRTYVTRHGAGLLPYECAREALGIAAEDATNVENPWQGRIRYATHGTTEEFLAPVREDAKWLAAGGSMQEEPQQRTANAVQNTTEPTRNCAKLSLFLTHVDETNRTVLTVDGPVGVDEFCGDAAVRDVFSDAYLACGREAEQVESRSLDGN